MFCKYVKYIVSVYIINIFKPIVLYLTISFILTVIHNASADYIFSLIKAIHSFTPVVFLLQIKICNVLIHIVAEWFASWLITLWMKNFLKCSWIKVLEKLDEHSCILCACVAVSRSKHSIRSQKKNCSNIHSQCAAVLLTNHDSNLYLLTNILVRHTVIHALCIYQILVSRTLWAWKL